MEGGDDNSIRPMACQSGKISVFLEHFFLFLKKIFILQIAWIFSRDPILALFFLFVLEEYSL